MSIPLSSTSYTNTSLFPAAVAVEEEVEAFKDEATTKDEAEDEETNFPNR